MSLAGCTGFFGKSRLTNARPGPRSQGHQIVKPVDWPLRIEMLPHQAVMYQDSNLTAQRVVLVRTYADQGSACALFIRNDASCAATRYNSRDRVKELAIIAKA